MRSQTCVWSVAGAAPYGPDGDVFAAVDRHVDIPEADRLALKAAIREGTPSEITRVTSKGLISKRFVNFRDLNFAGGRICPGNVDTSLWPPEQSQIAQIFASGPHAIVYLPGCGNVGRADDTQWRAPPPKRRALFAPTTTNTVDEPSTLGLLAAAMAAGWLINRRRR